MKPITLAFLLSFLLLLPLLARAGCDCSPDEEGRDKAKSLRLKIAAIFSILVCSSIGVCIPVLGKWLPALQPEKDVFFIVKAFAAGVILATGFIHILPDGFNQLTSPCLNESPWQDFPFAGFFAMTSAMATLMIDTLATGYFSSRHFKQSRAAVGDEVAKAEGAQESNDGGLPIHVHTHAIHGHAHGATDGALAPPPGASISQLIRYRVIAQVFELGIIVHSVIIGISLGASQQPKVIRPLVAALSFHQFFEGMGLGGCIAQAKFKLNAVMTMGLFFSLTTPVGIAVGIGVSSSYNENSPKALIVEGILDSFAAGILIYMALVDLLAEDFMNPKVQGRWKLQLAINVSLLIGAGLMSLLAKWA